MCLFLAKKASLTADYNCFRLILIKQINYIPSQIYLSYFVFGVPSFYLIEETFFMLIEVSTTLSWWKHKVWRNFNKLELTTWMISNLFLRKISNIYFVAFTQFFMRFRREDQILFDYASCARAVYYIYLLLRRQLP